MHIEIVTPTGTAVATEADEVVAPGSEGEFGVLPGHVAFLSAMKAGVLRYRVGATQHRLAVGTGLIEVAGHDRVVVLTDRVARAADIDAAQARRDLEAAEAAGKGGDVTAEARRAWAQAQLDAQR